MGRMSSATSMPYFRFEIHPITDRPFWQRVSDAPQTRDLAESVQRIAGDASVQPPIPLASEFRAAKWQNDRKKLDHHWQHNSGIFAALCVARCLDGDTAAGVDTRLLDWLWARLTQPTWVVSAHLPDNELPDPRWPQLDLAACEMAATLAEAMVLLRPWIDNQSSTLASTIVYEIDRRVLAPFTAFDKIHWADFDRPLWNNWTGVCAGTVLAACESLAEAGHPRPEARAKAIRLLDLFLKRSFTPAGECDEGIGYWSYGIGFAAIGWSRLPEADFRSGIDQARFRSVVDYPRQVHLFDDYFFSGNDANLQAGPPAFATTWLGATSGSKWLIDWMPPSFQEAQHWRALPVLLRGIDSRMRLPADRAPLPQPPAARFLADQQTAIVVDPHLTITFSGGNNDENHNHNDLGHFCIWCDRQLIVPDIGAPYYTADFFGPNRYDYLTANSRGHCCPVINGHAQRAGTAAQGVMLVCDLKQQRFTIDMTSAYPEEAGLKRWARSFQKVSNDAFEIVDQFEVDRESLIESILWSVIEPAVSCGSIRLGPVTIEISPPANASVQMYQSDELKLRTPNHPLYQISLPSTATPGQPLEMRMRVRLT
jgi:hypothetical protein